MQATRDTRTNKFQFIDEFDIELVNQNLSFDTVDSHVSGTVDLFTTKPIGSDRKLYKTIDRNWDQYLQDHQLLQQQDPIPSPPNQVKNDQTIPENASAKQRSYSTSTISTAQKPVLIRRGSHSIYANQPGMSRSLHSNNGYISPSSLTDSETCVFGPLHQTTSRRTFAYLIGILNTSYPDHDFSSLNPDFFKSIPSSTKLVNSVNNLLVSLGKTEQDLNWIWDIINNHMDLSECVSFELDNDFLKREVLNSPSVLWCSFYFIYNKKRKRVAFIQLKSTFMQLRRGSLLQMNTSRDLLSSENEYDLTNDIDSDAIMEEEDEELEVDIDDDYDDVVGDLEF